ncbi:MAG: hypothetical protein RTU30_03175 [Candidatus Thorarchaeota archaeon]
MDISHSSFELLVGGDVDNQLELMVTYLVYLQFYSEDEDILFSRDKKVKVSIPGIGPVVDAFVEEFMRPIHLISSGDYRLYLDELAKTLPFDADQIEQEFNRSMGDLPPAEHRIELIANFLIGPIRSALQKREFEDCMDNVIDEAMVRVTDPKTRSTLRSRLEDLYSHNDPSVSLLYNLVLVRLLASIYGNEVIRVKVDEMVQTRCNDLVTKLSIES